MVIGASKKELEKWTKEIAGKKAIKNTLKENGEKMDKETKEQLEAMLNENKIEIYKHERTRQKHEPTFVGNEFFKIDTSNIKKNERVLLSALITVFNETSNEYIFEADLPKFINEFMPHLRNKKLTRKQKNEEMEKASREILKFQAREERKKGQKIFTVFSYIDIDEDENKIRVKVNPDFKETFQKYQKKGNDFTIYFHEELAKFQSKYTQNLYWYLKHYEYQKKIELTPAQLRKQIGAKPTETTSNIKRIIETARKDFKKYEVFENLEIKTTKNEDYNEQGYKYKTIKSYIFLFKDKPKKIDQEAPAEPSKRPEQEEPQNLFSLSLEEIKAIDARENSRKWKDNLQAETARRINIEEDKTGKPLRSDYIRFLNGTNFSEEMNNGNFKEAEELINRHIKIEAMEKETAKIILGYVRVYKRHYEEEERKNDRTMDN